MFSQKGHDIAKEFHVLANPLKNIGFHITSYLFQMDTVLYNQ